MALSSESLHRAMSKSNVSFELVNLGPWSDSLLAGIGGSPSRVNIMEPLESALPMIRNYPQFDVGFMQNDTPTRESTNAEIATGILSTVFFPQGGAPIPTSGLSGFTFDKVFKYGLISIVGLTLIIFGLWILLAPTTKLLIKEATHV